MNPYVRTVVPQPDYRLVLTFTNGEIRLFDMSSYLDKGVFRALRDPEHFARAVVEAGSVEWPGEIDLSYDTLYLRSIPIEQAAAA